MWLLGGLPLGHWHQAKTRRISKNIEQLSFLQHIHCFPVVLRLMLPPYNKRGKFDQPNYAYVKYQACYDHPCRSM